MSGSVAIRYARALYQEAQAQDVDKQIYEYLGVLYSSMKATPDLQITLTNPIVKDEQKFKLLATASGINEEVAKNGGKALAGQSAHLTLYSRFLRLVLQHKRESNIRLMILVYRDMYRDAHNIDRIIFETAVPASPEVLDKLKERVKAKTGRGVECDVRVRPSLIGGFRLRIGDIRYDYSYATKLEKIKKKLLCQNK